MSHLITHGAWTGQGPVHAVVTRELADSGYHVHLQTFARRRAVQRIIETDTFDKAVRVIDALVPGFLPVRDDLEEQFGYVVDAIGPEPTLREAGYWFASRAFKLELGRSSQYVTDRGHSPDVDAVHPTREAAVDAILGLLAQGGYRTVEPTDRGPDPACHNERLLAVRIAADQDRFPWRADVWIAVDDVGEVYARMYDDTVTPITTSARGRS